MTNSQNNQSLSVPGAIIIAGIIVAAAVLIAFTGGNNGAPLTNNDTPEQGSQAGISIAQAAEDIGLNADDFAVCMTENDDVLAKVERDMDNAVATGGRGTPHSIIITPDGNMFPVSGALPIGQWNQILDGLQSGDGDFAFNLEDPAYEVLPVGDDEFIRGNSDAPYTIIEYSDANCGFCKQLHGTLKTLVAERDDVRWVYRHFPILSPNSQEKAIAAECAATLGGEDAYWDFLDIILGA